MSQYSYNKSGIGKVYAFEATIRNVPKYNGYTYTDPDLIIFTTESLTNEELASLETTIQNYSDPAVFLVLNSTIPDTIRSKTTNSTTPDVVQTFIFTNSNQYGTGTFNAIKTVLEYSTDDVSQWTDFDGQLTVTFEIYCYTRAFTIGNYTINVTDVANSWKQMALTNETGSRTVYRTFLVEGLRNVVANHDCLWNYILNVSDSNLKATIHAKQMLYYDIM